MTHSSALNERIIEDIYNQGWSVQPQYFDAALIAGLAEEAQHAYRNQQMHNASIGRGSQKQQNKAIRRDAIQWLAFNSPLQQDYQDLLEKLRQELNRNLMLGLFEFEAHFAIYEAGDFYKQHLDSFKGAANRVISTVTYLNADWPENAGGELLIFANDGESLLQTVKPIAGSLVVFLSEEIPHEVQVCQQQRLSIAGWFRINNPT